MHTRKVKREQKRWIDEHVLYSKQRPLKGEQGIRKRQPLGPDESEHDGVCVGKEKLPQGPQARRPLAAGLRLTSSASPPPVIAKRITGDPLTLDQAWREIEISRNPASTWTAQTRPPVSAHFTFLSLESIEVQHSIVQLCGCFLLVC